MAFNVTQGHGALHTHHTRPTLSLLLYHL